MTGKLRSWLASIIILVIFAFLIVFEPITWGSRKQLIATADSGSYLAKVASVYLYSPFPNIRLGLDLQGGSHVVLKGRPQVIYELRLEKPIGPEEDEGTLEEIQQALQAQIAGRLSEEELKKLFTEADVEVFPRRITVRADLVEGPSTKELAGHLRDVVAEVLGDRYGKIRVGETETMALGGDRLSQVIRIIEERVNRLGLSEAVIQRQDPDKIIVELPGAQNPEEIMRILRTTAVLEFRHIPKKYEVVQELGEREPYFTQDGEEVSPEQVVKESRLIVRGDQLKSNSYVDYGAGTNQPVVTFEFKREGADKFWAFTRTHIGQHLAIVLDGKIISAPVVKAAIRGRGIIEGSFSVSEAQNLSVLLNAGSLPIPLDVAARQTVSASLGKDSLVASLYAGLIGLALVLVFMAWYYRLPGLLADLALLIYCVLLLAVLKLFGATLTLPGIAGMILSIAMAVDANVIIFERLKEELRAEKTLKSAIEAGFKRAWTAILDSNVCSILTALVLMGFGTAAVKGFAITLLIGVACSMFTAITITRLFMNITAGTRAARKLAWFGV